MAELDRAKLLAARYRAATDRPYLATALYALSVVTSDTVPTMGVDRHWRCYVAPDFVDRTPVAELAGAWIHEVAHLLRAHHARADRLPQHQQHDHTRVNVAQDCEVNDNLLADGLTLPAGRMEPGRFGLPKGWLFEAYLAHLPPDLAIGHDCGSGAHGQPRPWESAGADVPAVSPMEADALRRTTAEAIRAHGRGRGTLPRGWRRWAEEILKPMVDWRRVLAGAVREAVAWASGASDYTYRRPSRRSAALRGVALPSLRRPLPTVAIVVDTSGSMGEDDLAAAMAEVSGVLREVGVHGNRVAVLACDADVHVTSRVTTAAQLTLAGGGGTDLRVGIVAALALPERPRVVIALTDGHTPWPAEPTSCRLIAVLIGRRPRQPPSWVETVRLAPDAPAGRGHPGGR